VKEDDRARHQGNKRHSATPRKPPHAPAGRSGAPRPPAARVRPRPMRTTLPAAPTRAWRAAAAASVGQRARRFWRERHAQGARLVVAPVPGLWRQLGRIVELRGGAGATPAAHRSPFKGSNGGARRRNARAATARGRRAVWQT